MGGDAGLELGQELFVAEHLQVILVEALEARLDDGADAGSFVAGGQPDSGGEAGAGCLVALVAAEDEHDRREELALGQEVDDLEAARREEDRRPLPRGVRWLRPARRTADASRRAASGFGRPPTNVGRK